MAGLFHFETKIGNYRQSRTTCSRGRVAMGSFSTRQAAVAPAGPSSTGTPCPRQDPASEANMDDCSGCAVPRPKVGDFPTTPVYCGQVKMGVSLPHFLTHMAGGVSIEDSLV